MTSTDMELFKSRVALLRKIWTHRKRLLANEVTRGRMCISLWMRCISYADTPTRDLFNMFNEDDGYFLEFVEAFNRWLSQYASQAAAIPLDELASFVKDLVSQSLEVKSMVTGIAFTYKIDGKLCSADYDSLNAFTKDHHDASAYDITVTRCSEYLIDGIKYDSIDKLSDNIIKILEEMVI